MPNRLIPAVFVVAALYDAILGFIFLLAPRFPFELFEVTPPNHFAYVQFPAALLLIFALMFMAIAKDPAGKRPLIAYGMLLKISYCSLVFFYWITQDIPGMFKPFAFIDLVMLALFAWAYVVVARPAPRPLTQE